MRVSLRMFHFLLKAYVKLFNLLKLMYINNGEKLRHFYWIERTYTSVSTLRTTSISITITMKGYLNSFESLES